MVHVSTCPPIRSAPEQAEALGMALSADKVNWANDTKQEAQSGNTIYVFRKMNLAAGESPTIVRYGYSAALEVIALTVTGTAMPTSFELKKEEKVIEGATEKEVLYHLFQGATEIKRHDVVALAKEAAKRKANRHAEDKRQKAFAKLGV